MAEDGGRRALASRLAVGMLVVAATLAVQRLAADLGTLVPAILAEEPPTALWNRDGTNYWFAPRLALEAMWSTLHDADAYAAALSAEASRPLEMRNWSYPPTMLLVLLPFGAVPFQLSIVLFPAVTLVGFVAAAWAAKRSLAPRLPTGALVLALLPALAINLSGGQNGWLTGALLLGALATWRDRPFLSGLLLGLLVVKPHLAVLLGLLALVAMQPQRIVGAALSSLGLIAVSTFVFGVQAWEGYLTEIVPYQARVPFEWSGWFLYGMLGGLPWGLREGLTAEGAWAVQGLVAFVALALLVPVLRRVDRPLIAAVAVLAASLCLVPYAFDYDACALLVLCGLAAATPGNGAPLRLASALIPASITLLATVQYATSMPLAPILLLGVLSAAAAGALDLSAYTRAARLPASSM